MPVCLAGMVGYDQKNHPVSAIGIYFEGNNG